VAHIGQEEDGRVALRRELVIGVAGVLQNKKNKTINSPAAGSKTATEFRKKRNQQNQKEANCGDQSRLQSGRQAYGGTSADHERERTHFRWRRQTQTALNPSANEYSRLTSTLGTIAKTSKQREKLTASS
jgi:hypothetical protein